MGCTHDCSSCSSDCKSKEQNLHEELNKYSSVKKVIGVVSGKGGVGKSLVTSMLAVTFNRLGKSTAILDADITGPSIPKAFGVHERCRGNDEGIFPVVTETGIKMISVNLLLEHETDPVVWRSPVITGTVKQFWKDVIWENVDYMFVDMPPGTGDVPLTVFQSLPIDGIVIVASPQELVSMIVQKAVKMARMMNVPILGLVENMSWFMCPDCGKKMFCAVAETKTTVNSTMPTTNAAITSVIFRAKVLLALAFPFILLSPAPRLCRTAPLFSRSCRPLPFLRA